MHKCVEHSGVVIRGQEDRIPALEEAALLKGLELSHNFDMGGEAVLWGHTCREKGGSHVGKRRGVGGTEEEESG